LDSGESGTFPKVYRGREKIKIKTSHQVFPYFIETGRKKA
jgi:hypothetical protein